MILAKIEQDIIESGWKKFKSAVHRRERFYIESFQAKITDEKGIRYFINCDKFDYKHDDKFTYVFNMQFKNKKSQHVNIETCQWHFYEDKYNNYVSTLTDVYILAEDIWESLGADYYEVNL
jgi:hypothetical protein